MQEVKLSKTTADLVATWQSLLSQTPLKEVLGWSQPTQPQSQTAPSDYQQLQSELGLKGSFPLEEGK